MARTPVGRRQFVASSSFLLLGAGYLDTLQAASQAVPSGVDLKEELTPTEAELVNQSSMAKDLDNFFGRGHSCAEAGLAIALRALKQPQELVWMAGGFGGGLGHRDLCGFLTTGVMAIGLCAGTLGLDRTEAKRLCLQKTREYWTWWTSTAPLRCAEIQGNRGGLKVCHRLGRLAAVELERLIGSLSVAG